MAETVIEAKIHHALFRNYQSQQESDRPDTPRVSIEEKLTAVGLVSPRSPLADQVFAIDVAEPLY